MRMRLSGERVEGNGMIGYGHLTTHQSFASSKQYLCCICSNNPRLHHSLFATTGNADSRTFALYYVVFTILIQFLCYEHLDHIPQMKRLLMSIQRLSKKRFPGRKELHT